MESTHLVFRTSFGGWNVEYFYLHAGLDDEFQLAQCFLVNRDT